MLPERWDYEIINKNYERERERELMKPNSRYVRLPWRGSWRVN